MDWTSLAVMFIPMLLSLVIRPKVPEQKAPETQVPEAKEGAKIKKVYGTVWIEDPQWLGFQKIKRDRIRKKGGKK